ncbi:bile acid:sodium symporter [Streptomyces sp. MST-110588]|uniref:bile acid:sodium symporter family protein n=1 Tax=Streptomyces sp. MST-110588 TaxID=2833628 RepID=UPI001F5C6157|nr:bile acid:sodium symporter [Streptomyces sp. MST-110588]UNO38563.1 bile acid:sodium symporter [Streptomyces sp. MST-110588]
MTGVVVAAVQRWLLGLMLGCYVLAGVFPGPGRALRGPILRMPVGAAELTLPMVLLAVMLFTAGLGVRVTELRTVVRRPLRLVLGIVANALLPVLVLPVVALALRAWPDPGEAEGLVVGLLLVLAMPIAGGAASWGQHAGGNVPLAVAMVVGSTVLSPLTVPLGMHLTGRLVGPSGAGALDDTSTLDLLARTGAGVFALVAVVLPCLAGILVRIGLGDDGVRRVLPAAKAVNLVNILLLCYINAVGALGQALARPDPDLLLLALGISGAVCCLTFWCGRWISRWTRCDRPDGVSLTFATGMNNSSAAAVLAAGWFSHRPGVLVPILSYSLLQKIVAGVAGRPRRPGPRLPAGPLPAPARGVTHRRSLTRRGDRRGRFSDRSRS